MKLEKTVSNRRGKGSFRSKDYKILRVYLLRFFRPRDIVLIKNNIERRV